MTKIDKISKLLKQRVEDNYIQRIEYGQEMIETIIHQADEAINQLAKEEVDNDDDDDDSDHLQKKKQIIALYNTYTKIPFSPVKNDVVNIAHASTLTQALINDNKTTTESLISNNENKRVQINQLHQTVSQYKQLFENIESLIQDKKQSIEDIHEQSSTVDSIRNNLQLKLKQTTATEVSMDHHLRQVIKLYITLDSPNSDANQVHEIISDMVHNEWVPIAPSNVVSMLNLNNMLMFKDGLMKLRVYDQ